MGGDSTREPAGRPVPRLRGRDAICFPVAALYGERYIDVGAATVIGPYASLSAGVSPAQELGDTTVVRIGTTYLIGKGSGIVGHERIEIGDDVFTGHHVYVADANHRLRGSAHADRTSVRAARAGVRSGRAPGSGTAPSCCPGR